MIPTCHNCWNCSGSLGAAGSVKRLSSCIRVIPCLLASEVGLVVRQYAEGSQLFLFGLALRLLSKRLDLENGAISLARPPGSRSVFAWDS